MADLENNNSLYFIVGGLVVIAAIFGVVYWNNNHGPEAIEPAAGVTTSDSGTLDTDTDRTNFSFDENGGSITHTETEQ